jgi:hypothetical protein
MAFPEDDKVIETLISYRFYEPFRVRVAVGTLCRNGRALDSIRLQQRRPCLGEQWISVVDQVARLAQEAVLWVKEIPGHLKHPGPVRRNADPSYLHDAGLHLGNEQSLCDDFVDSTGIGERKAWKDSLSAPMTVCLGRLLFT